jgi:sugar/nucleoside kinase (ribokinase family)
MYTAMAAHRSGMQVSLFGPRPNPIPKMLRPIAERLTAWLGPAIPPEELPHFEIAYHDGKTTYLRAFVDAESDLMPGALPPDLSPYDCVHITPLGDVHRQFAFLQACHQRGAKRISVGTGPFLVDEPGVVRSIMEQADIFFMNEKEAAALFGSVEMAKTWPGKLLFVTLGERGAVVIQGDFVTEVPGVPANELDPTGAGDTFCGATLAHLSMGEHPVMAARLAMPLAAQMIEHVGPTALLWPQPPPAAPVDARVVVDESRVKRVSQLIP